MRDQGEMVTINGVEERGLTVGLLVFGGGIADIVAKLGATDETNVRVGLVWLQRWQ